MVLVHENPVVRLSDERAALSPQDEIDAAIRFSAVSVWTLQGAQILRGIDWVCCRVSLV